MVVKPTMLNVSAIKANRYRHLLAEAMTKYHIEVFGADKSLKWCDDFRNLVTTEGLNALLDATFVTGSVGPTWFIGLVAGAVDPVYDDDDVMAGHAGWTEFLDIEEETRQAFTPGAVSEGSVNNSLSKAEFNITKAGKVAGCFLANESTLEGTTGKLYGEGSFALGTRDLDEGDVIKVTITLTVCVPEIQ